MNYEFHVGDYVETIAGGVGYIKEISEKANTFTILWKNINGNDYEQMYWFDHYAPNRRKWEDDFARIGAYDFTKKEKKKIEPISDCNKHIFANAIKSDNQLVRTVSNDIVNKINELVDAVNTLMDKENNK